MQNIFSHNDETYRTSDTQLAAYLQSQGYELIEIIHNQHATFCFVNDTDQLQEDIRLFYAGKAQVEPTLYMRNYKSLVRKAREGLPA